MSTAPKGKWGEGRRRPELCFLVTTKFHQNSQIKHTSYLYPNCCSLGSQWQLIDSHWKPSFHSAILLKVKMVVLWIRKAWSLIFIKAYLHSSGRSRGQRTPQELPSSCRGVDRRGWNVDCKEEGFWVMLSPLSEKQWFPWVFRVMN